MESSGVRQSGGAQSQQLRRQQEHELIHHDTLRELSMDRMAALCVYANCTALTSAACRFCSEAFFLDSSLFVLSTATFHCSCCSSPSLRSLLLSGSSTRSCNLVLGRSARSCPAHKRTAHCEPAVDPVRTFGRHQRRRAKSERSAGSGQA